MSVLTKLFIVLLVVTSLLLSAATVVFVNRVEDFKKTSTDAKSALALANTAAEAARSSEREYRTQIRAVEADAEKKVDALKSEIAANAKVVLEKEASIAQLTKDAQVQLATTKGQSDAVRSTQEENKGLQSAITDSRTKNDSLLKENGELNKRVTELDRKNEQLARANAYAQERLVELIAENAKLITIIRANGGMQNNPAVTAAAAGPINGVVRSVDVIGGKKYATISVGSSDNVAKGMKFNVINTRTGDFLGYLTVDSVQPNEAIGQLEGKVDQIQAGVEVKTQL